MWKSEHRRAADRHGLRYPSELSDSEWALIEAAPHRQLKASRKADVLLVRRPGSPLG